MSNAARRLWLVCRHILVAFALLFVMVTVTPLTRWWVGMLSGPWMGTQGDVLVVLGGSTLADALGDSSYLRAVYAVRAMRETQYRKVILCGKGSASFIRDFIAGHGLPLTNIELDQTSGSTRENAIEALAILRKISPPAGSVVLLTSDYHMFRASRVFRKAGVEVRPHPIPDVLKRYSFWNRRWNAFLDLCEEQAKMSYYAFRGWM
jgi:uncharacterized SAM-binding protein YcdF (DUF218 family)